MSISAIDKALDKTWEGLRDLDQALARSTVDWPRSAIANARDALRQIEAELTPADAPRIDRVEVQEPA